MGPLTRVLGWKAEEVSALVAKARALMPDRKMHAYILL